MKNSDQVDEKLINEDLAPVPQEHRTWSKWNIAALWVGMAVCIPTYQMASSMIGGGMTWWQALLLVFLGNLIVLVPMTLNAHPGTRYGIPFPVLLRASFGVYGANIAAILRGIVACGWFGIQTWIGGAAIYSTLAMVTGFDTTTAIPLPMIGVSIGQLSCFVAFWLLNVFFIWNGMKSIKWLETISAPFLLVIGVLLMIWAVTKANGFGPVFSQPSGYASNLDFWKSFGAGLTAMVGFWATLSLNIPDFSRFAKSQRDQVIGQVAGLPTTMTFYSFIGIVVTSATVIIYGKAIWDPVEVISRIGSKTLSCTALVALAIATLSTNIAANVVSPANDFSNLSPKHISFRTGGMITAIIGIFIMPWKLMADPSGYIFVWLIGYSALLGPIAGIMIADYFVFRKKHLEVDALYQLNGIYRFTRGYSLAGMAAFISAVLPNLPGFLAEVRWINPDHVPEFFKLIYPQAWFTGFTIAMLAYLLFRKISPAPIRS
ncbi:NCS1 family nucleobase:cation symporter-1 [Luteolibacter pohnpeiensis]|uniref:NCS1 family nucleobase:cation symporter-1 n=1 Tax=Luteolibacter pohnpeiensis TaxID=454153 RepID=A0A934S8R4_9BACT|nr:NCS1 family nucleobase:cation symporter-1 [Luteolibacter pohnpeiensis]MBK1881439.1 NCS1 family nucleobase:cation symporter-1 [Luteolibacter pohnpeiensis]